MGPRQSPMRTGTRRSAAILLVAVVASALMSLMGGAKAASCPACAPVAEPALRLLDMVNSERATAGLAPLAARSDIEAVAQPHTDSMASTGTLAHNDSYFTAANREHLKASHLGENVAVNSDLEDAHRRLMASEGHRANILSARFKFAGFSVVQDSEGRFWITQNFVEPRPVAAAAAPAPAPAAAPVRPAARPAAPAPVAAPVIPAVEAPTPEPSSVEAVATESGPAPESAEVSVALASKNDGQTQRQSLVLLGAVALMIAIGLAGTAIGVRHSLAEVE